MTVIPPERASRASSVAPRLGSSERPVPVIQNSGADEISPRSSSPTSIFESGAFGIVGAPPAGGLGEGPPLRGRTPDLLGVKVPGNPPHRDDLRAVQRSGS